MKFTFLIAFCGIIMASCGSKEKGYIPTEAELAKIEPANAWFYSGSHSTYYVMGYESGKGPDGSNAGTIISKVETIDGFGTLATENKPGKYLGKKIRMSGYMKTKDVAEWAGLWLRIDQEGTDKPLSFDNMADRPIEGTTDWKKYEIVLDVPSKASNIAFGALLAGTGQVWFDNITFEILDSIAPVGEPDPHAMPWDQLNLDFENKFQFIDIL